MKFIIAFLFVSSSGYESLNTIENKAFNSEVQCKSYIKQYYVKEHYAHHSKLNYYCVDSIMVEKNHVHDKIKIVN